MSRFLHTFLIMLVLSLFVPAVSFAVENEIVTCSTITGQPRTADFPAKPTDPAGNSDAADGESADGADIRKKVDELVAGYYKTCKETSYIMPGGVFLDGKAQGCAVTGNQAQCAWISQKLTIKNMPGIPAATSYDVIMDASQVKGGNVTATASFEVYIFRGPQFVGQAFQITKEGNQYTKLSGPVYKNK